MHKTIHTPHDRFTRAALSEKRVAIAFFQTHLPLAVKEIIDFNSLELSKESFVDEALQQSVTDMLFSVNFNNQPGYIYLLVEHQSQIDKFMSLRLLEYTLDIMKQHLKITGQEHLPIVYPMVLYNGKHCYTGPTSLLDLFAETHKDLAKQVFFHPFHLIDLTQISDQTMREQLWSSVLELCLKHIYDRDIIPFIKEFLDSLHQVEQAGGQSLVQAALTYLIVAGEVESSDLFLKIVEDGLSEKMREKIMTIAQQIERKGMQKGMERGIEKGMEQGIQQGEYSLVLRLLERKFKTVSQHYRQRLIEADAETLLIWGERVLDAKTLAEIFE